MDHHDLTGYYTYRSLLNRPDPADDFNTIRFGEGELFLWVGPDGAIRGTLALPGRPARGGPRTSWTSPAGSPAGRR